MGFSATTGDVKYDLDDHAWITSQWKNSSQRRKADMGDPMAVKADMAEMIASTAEGLNRTGKTVHSESGMAATEDLWTEVSVDLPDIDVDRLESQPEMAFGTVVKKRSEVKVSTLTPKQKTTS